MCENSESKRLPPRGNVGNLRKLNRIFVSVQGTVHTVILERPMATSEAIESHCKFSLTFFEKSIISNENMSVCNHKNKTWVGEQPPAGVARFFMFSKSFSSFAMRFYHYATLRSRMTEKVSVQSRTKFPSALFWL